MPARSEERTNARKEEIINACEMLYQTMNFKDITIKEIGNVTSFSRTSIYNYFETKEEIFLALLKREYDAWILDLHKIVEEHESMDDEQIASAIAKSLDQRHQLLKILSMNHYDLEENSRIEMLIEFKVSYGNSLRAVMGILAKFRPDMDIEKRQEFVYAFFPFMFGIYPYTVVTKKQKKAMKEAGVELMIMLGADSIQTQDFSFTVDVEIGNSTVRNYLNSRHQLVVNMMNRTDFPRDIEALKTTVGVLYNYFGVRSICKMYAKDYTEEVDNTIIIQKLSKVLFEEINSFMVGWFNEAQVELSFVSYMKIMWPMLQSYFGKE